MIEAIVGMVMLIGILCAALGGVGGFLAILWVRSRISAIEVRMARMPAVLESSRSPAGVEQRPEVPSQGPPPLRETSGT